MQELAHQAPHIANVHQPQLMIRVHPSAPSAVDSPLSRLPASLGLLTEASFCGHKNETQEECQGSCAWAVVSTHM